MAYIGTYEEAKEYLEKDIGGAYDRQLKRTAVRNALLIAAGGSAVVLAIAAVTRHPEIDWFVIPMLAWSLSAFSGLIRRKADIVMIGNGAYFQKLKPAEVIDQANRQLAAAEKDRGKDA